MAREFWISLDHKVEDFVSVSTQEIPSDERYEIIHVIEKSAYDEMKTNFELVCQTNDINTVFSMQLDAKYAKAVDALKFDLKCFKEIHASSSLNLSAEIQHVETTLTELGESD